MPDQTELIAQLTRRLETMEDEREVRNVIMRYSLAVDTNDADATEAVYWGDAVVEVDGGKQIMRGREVRNLCLGPSHQAIVGYCSHMLAPLMVEVNGNNAVGTGYMVVIVRNRGGDGAWVRRQSYNRFDLEKRGGIWKIAKRISYVAGTPEALDVLKRALHPSASE